jgi:hypothetical protein
VSGEYHQLPVLRVAAVRGRAIAERVTVLRPPKLRWSPQHIARFLRRAFADDLSMRARPEAI